MTMKCFHLLLSAALLQPCNSLSLGVDRGSGDLTVALYYYLLCFGAVVLVLIICYIFYPAYKNIEGGLGFSTTVLAGGDKRSDQENILSLVIPAYNEAERLPIMLDDTFKFLNSNRKELTQLFTAAVGDTNQKTATASPSEQQLLQCEFVIVNDGSTDDTENVVKKYITNMTSSGDDTVKLVSMYQNCGKGGAVKTGMLQSSGQLCLMVDADGATDISDGLPKLLKDMTSAIANKRNSNSNSNSNSSDSGYYLPPAAVFGSRAHMENESCASRSKIRTFLMHSFHFFVKTLCSHRINDTQCGFKLFTRSAVAMLFTNLHLRRWAFDTELVVIAEKLDVSLSEVGVIWHEIDGSKLDLGKISLALVSLGMLRDMVCVRACYALSIWRLKR